MSLDGTFTDKKFILNKPLNVVGTSTNKMQDCTVVLLKESSGSSVSNLNIANHGTDIQGIFLNEATKCNIFNNKINNSGPSSFPITLNPGSNYNNITKCEYNICESNLQQKIRQSLLIFKLFSITHCISQPHYSHDEIINIIDAKADVIRLPDICLLHYNDFIEKHVSLFNILIFLISNSSSTSNPTSKPNTSGAQGGGRPQQRARAGGGRGGGRGGRQRRGGRGRGGPRRRAGQQ